MTRRPDEPERGMRGAARVDVRAGVQADPTEFIALALDLDRLRALHPRLEEACWLDTPGAYGSSGADVPAVGSRAEIVVALPTALHLLEPIIGAPRGVLTLTGHDPGRSISYRLDSDRVTGIVELIAGPTESTPAITVRGALWANASLARTAMLPTLPLIEPALGAAVRRTAARADELLLG